MTQPSEGFSCLAGAVLISTAEFALKSQPVRHILIRLLKKHIRFNLKRSGLETGKMALAGGFLVISNLDDAEDVARQLTRVFGVAHADACERTLLDLNEIAECTGRLAEQKLKPKETFAVRARNFEPSLIKGKEIEIRAGAEVLSRLPGRVKVNLSNPDHIFRVFYGANEAFVSSTRYNGPGGLPVGSQGKLLGVATDPARAPLSFYLLMKRGAMVWPVIPNFQPLLEGTRLEEIVDGLRRLAPLVPTKRYSARIMEPDEGASRVLEEANSSLQRILSIRLVFRAITHLVQAERALGLVTADSFGQNALESLKDLRVIEDIVRFPVYRPLLTLDEETMNQELEGHGLLQPGSKDAYGPASRVSPFRVSVKDLADFEKRIQAEELARRMAANATRVQISLQDP
jgi:thiamine biosynthesis protein ThiI